MKITARLLAVLITLAGVAGCKQAQLGGAVVDARVYIDLLNQPGAGNQYLDTTNTRFGIEEVGLEKWSSLPYRQKTFWLGTFEVDETMIEADQLYLLTATGGSDTDADRDGKFDKFTTPVAGSWRAIMPGAALLVCCNQVSALTEAAYQYVKDSIGYISDVRLLKLLDEFALLVVKDVNGDKRVNYADVLLWSRIFSEAKYLGDIGLLDNLADVITRGEPDYVLRAAAESVVRNEQIEPTLPPPVAATVLTGNVAGDLVLTRAQSPYVVRGGLNVDGDLLIEPGVAVASSSTIGAKVAVNVYGRLFVEGLPRQRVKLESLSITVFGSASDASSSVLNADIASSDLNLKIRQLLVEGNRLHAVNLWVANVVKSEDSRADVQRNIISASTLTFINSGPVRPSFVTSFENNYCDPDVAGTTTVRSRWAGPLENFTIRNNSFHENMRFLLDALGAQMDISYNYWGPMGFPSDKMTEIIPANADLGPLDPFVVPFQPWLSVHPAGTPIPW